MKNVTISMDDELHRATRIEAVIAANGEKGEERNPQLKALERFLAGPKWDVMEDGRMPTAEERNARR
ncbi:hypothetical protein [Chelativorans sp. AA-79]|uniref:hypothetical protein n=1 Tax=Chelativorans sp. AA-79 TaxID=3028735 RepID=UPI0023F9E033|nr:hypothetical protein [Chelativorans sp. AA-79]WEX07900.1 hypothetical protein PVE73_17605 [Chelativorans sp. AA-79]